MRDERSRRKTLYCVYALTDSAASPRFTCAGRRLRAVEIDGLRAIVEAVVAPPRPTEDVLRRQHDLVVRLARRFDALLPVRFGAVVSGADLEARVAASRRAIRRALDRVRGRVQMTVRLHRTASRLRPNASGTEWLVARSERDRLLRQCAARVRRGVAGVIEDERIDPGKGELLGTVYHLIASTNVREHEAGVATVAGALPPVRVTVSGPWPAFAFVPDLGRGVRG